MGIRVNKAIGYGLTDIKTRRVGKYHRELADPRINPRGLLGDSGDAEHTRWSYEAYCKFLPRFKWGVPTPTGAPRREYADLELFQLRNSSFNKDDVKVWFHAAVECDQDYGLHNVLLVIPPMCLPSWRRHDETLDWMEETECHQQQPRVLELKEAPFPWNVRREDLRTGRLIPGDDWRIHGYGNIPGKRWRWVVPAEIAAVCKFFKLFKSDETIRNLKPLLYVWWA